MTRILPFVFFILLSTFNYAQTNDSIPTNEEIPVEESTPEETPVVATDSTSTPTTTPVKKEDDGFKTKGVSVSPAHFHLTQKPGESKTYQINVKNDTPDPKQFKVNVYDFNMNGKGKTAFKPAGGGEFSLSKWLNISPSFIELQPGEKRKINFSVQVPSGVDGERAAWSIIMIEQENPKSTLELPQRSEGTVAMQVIPTFAFGVFVYQNSPTLVADSIEITNFQFKQTDSLQTVYIETRNAGNGIAYCTSYIDLTHLESGKQQRLPVKKFTTLPGLVRDFVFVLPKALPRGEYLAIGVLDYEKSEEIQAAKMTFKLE